jgi:hypothetical protein
MRSTISKALIAGLATLSLTASVLATTEPAAAGHWRGGGWHGGGWHGGGWHGGWRRGGWHGGAGLWGPAIIGGLAAGALLTPYYGHGYGGGCDAYAPVYDDYGNYLGRQQVNNC